jgi:hypothetical protein
MKYIPIHPALVLLIAVIICGLIEDAPAATHRGAAITNATKSGMPMARKQRIETSKGGKFIYTAIAKPRFCFAVKNGRIAYMSEENAVKFGATRFRLSSDARKAAAKFTKTK